LGTTLVVFSLLIGLFWVRHLFFPAAAEAPTPNPMPAGAAIQRLLAGREWIEAALSLAFICLVVIVVTRLVSRNLVFATRTHVFLIFFALAGFGLFIRGGNLPAIAATYLVARGSEFFAVSFRRASQPGNLFGGAMLIGLAPLLYAPAAIYAVMVPLAMPIYMRNRREAVVALAGLLLPTFAWAYVWWGLGRPFGELYGLIAQALTTRVAAPPVDLREAVDILRLASAALIAACTVLSLGSFVIEARQIRTRAYRIHVYMIFLLVVACGGMALPCASVGDLPLIALPVSVVAASWFSRHNGRFSTILYLITILCVVVCNVMVMSGL
jgi:hypothetical protein